MRQLRGIKVGNLPILESVWELACNNNSPNNRRIIAKLFIKYFYFISNSSVFLPQSGNCGAAGAWGVRGEARFPPKNEILKRCSQYI